MASSGAVPFELIATLVGDLRRKDEHLLAKEEDLRLKDVLIQSLVDDNRVLNAELLSAKLLAAELQLRNLVRLRLAHVVELRGALEVCLQSHALRGGSAKVFLALLSKLPLGVAALQCCNADAKVVGDNRRQLHTTETLAAELARIMRRLNKDAHPHRSPTYYKDKGDRLLLARDGLSDSDVAIVSCVLKAFGFPVDVVDDELDEVPQAVAATMVDD